MAGQRGPDAGDPNGRPPEERPLIERLGLGLIAVVVTGMFAALAVVTLAGGELFLGVMAGTGALMTLWAAATGLRRG